MKPAPPVMRSFMGCGWERDADEEGDKGPLSPTALEGDEWGFVACGLWEGRGGGVLVGMTGWKPIPQESGPNSWRIR
jgi:hypothetical protein